MTEPQKKFATGAVRGTDADGTRYDLIPTVGLRRVAETCAEGAEKYGEHNWMKGIPIPDLLNHALRHIYLYISGDRSEDHLAHASWNTLAACHFDEQESSSQLAEMPMQDYRPEDEVEFRSNPLYTGMGQGRWEVVPADEVSEDGMTGRRIGYQVRWSVPDERGRYLWVGHYYEGNDLSLEWCQHAAERHAQRWNEEKRSLWEF